MSELNRIRPLMRALEIRTRVAEGMLRRRNVVACGVGYKVSGEEQTAVPSIVVSVTRKMPRQTLAPEDLVPRTVDDVPTDVIETGLIVPHAINRHARLRPARPGISIGHQNGTAGTLGAYVRRDGKLFILSNNHVLALLNKARVGDAILQPGPSDGGSLLDQIGSLAEFVPLQFLSQAASADSLSRAMSAHQSGGGLARLLDWLKRVLKGTQPVTPPPTPSRNYMDAALAGPLNPSLVNPNIVDVGGPPLGIALPALGTRVIKSGRTTALTQATILQLDVTVDVRYGERTARFVNQIVTGQLSQPGDSGSLVLDYERNAIGLLFSGSAAITVVNPIQTVLKALRAELILEGML